MRLNFKIVLLIFHLCFFSAAFAYHKECPYDGFYIGIGLGGVKTSGAFNSSTSINHSYLNFDGDLLSISGINFNDTSDSNDTSTQGAFYLGYGRAFFWGQNIEESQRHLAVYLGGEFFGSIADRSLSSQRNFNLSSQVIMDSGPVIDLNSQGTTNTSAHLNRWEYGLDLRPGILLTPTFLIYGRVGVAFNRLKVSQQNVEHYSITLREDGSDDAVTLTMQSNLNIQRSKNIAGLRLGGGLEDMFYKNWSLRIDYIYTLYENTSISKSGPTSSSTFIEGLVIPAVPNGFSNNTKIKLSSNTVMASINYYF